MQIDIEKGKKEILAEFMPSQPIWIGPMKFQKILLSPAASQIYDTQFTVVYILSGIGAT